VEEDGEEVLQCGRRRGINKVGASTCVRHSTLRGRLGERIAVAVWTLELKLGEEIWRRDRNRINRNALGEEEEGKARKEGR
jgi:hypothetical protein